MTRHGNRSAILGLAWAAAVAVLLPLLWLVGVAQAEIAGSCTATIAGADVRSRSSTAAGDAIDVREDQKVEVSMGSPAGFASHEVRLEFLGFRWTVSEKTDSDDTSFSETVNVEDYAIWGAGFYKVIGEASLSDGGACSGAALVNVMRNPLTTVAGVAAAGVAGIGVVGVGLSALSALREGTQAASALEDLAANHGLPASGPGTASPVWSPSRGSDWDHVLSRSRPGCMLSMLPAILLAGAAMTPEGGDAIHAPARSYPRATWRMRFSLTGMIGGLLTGLGGAVLLQQYAIAPLTRDLLIAALMVGFAEGIVVPSLVRALAVARLNGRIGRMERESIAGGEVTTARSGDHPGSAP